MWFYQSRLSCHQRKTFSLYYPCNANTIPERDQQCERLYFVAIVVANNNPLTDSRRPKKWPGGRKMETFLNTHPISTPSRFKMNLMKTFSVKVRKPHLWHRLAYHGAKCFATGIKIESNYFWTLYISEHYMRIDKYEMTWMKTFPLMAWVRYGGNYIICVCTDSKPNINIVMKYINDNINYNTIYGQISSSFIFRVI